MRGLIIGISVVAILAIAAFLIVNNSKNEEDSTTETQTTSETTTNTENNQTETNTNTPPAQSSVTITYNGSGFSPASVTVSTGGTVVVRNDSNRSIQFASDPHPAHTTNSELNVGQIAAGESKSFSVSKVGTWGYHDHINASETGTIIVQ